MVDVSRIRLKRKGLETLLSPLEAETLRILWSKDNARVRDIFNILKKKRRVALTSVAVILDRLYKKKLVVRNIEVGRGGYHYIYVPKLTRADFEHSILEKTVNKLIENFGNAAVTYFNERFSKKKEE